MVPLAPLDGKKSPKRLRKSALIALFLLVGGCSSGAGREAGGYFSKMFSSEFYRFYRMDIPQGNQLDGDAIARVKPGLTREQVVYLLGQPVLPSMFHDERWDYIYYLDSLQKEKQKYFKLTLFFDGDRVTRVRKLRPKQPQT